MGNKIPSRSAHHDKIEYLSSGKQDNREEKKKNVKGKSRIVRRTGKSVPGDGTKDSAQCRHNNRRRRNTHQRPEMTPIQSDCAINQITSPERSNRKIGR